MASTMINTASEVSFQNGYQMQSDGYGNFRLTSYPSSSLKMHVCYFSLSICWFDKLYLKLQILMYMEKILWIFDQRKCEPCGSMYQASLFSSLFDKNLCCTDACTRCGSLISVISSKGSHSQWCSTIFLVCFPIVSVLLFYICTKFVLSDIFVSRVFGWDAEESLLVK